MIPFVRMLTSSWTSRNLHDMLRACFCSRSWVKSYSYSWIHIWLLLQIYMAMLSKLWHLASPCDILPMEHGQTCGKIPILKVWNTGELHVTPEHRHPISVSGVKGLQTWQKCDMSTSDMKTYYSSWWLNQLPNEKYARQIRFIFPKLSGWKLKNTFELPPPVILLSQAGWR